MPRIQGSFIFAAGDAESKAFIPRLRQAPWWEDKQLQTNRLKQTVWQMHFGTPPVDQLDEPAAAVRRADVIDPFRIGMVFRRPAPAPAGR